MRANSAKSRRPTLHLFLGLHYLLGFTLGQAISGSIGVGILMALLSPFATLLVMALLPARPPRGEESESAPGSVVA